MAEPWFMWNGVDSRTMGVIVETYPPIVYPAERVETLTVPGRAGFLTRTEGEAVFDGYLKTIGIANRRAANPQAIAAWLRGSGELILGSEPGFVYYGRVLKEASLDRAMPNGYHGSVAFMVQPFKGQVPPESDITVTGEATVFNPGDVPAKPRFSVTFTVACTVAVGDRVMALYNPTIATEETVTIDCEAEMIIQDGILWPGRVYGVFPEIPKGNQTVRVKAPEVYSASKTYQEYDLCKTDSQPTYLNLRVPYGEGDDGTEWLRIGDITGRTTAAAPATLKPRWRWL